MVKYHSLGEIPMMAVKKEIQINKEINELSINTMDSDSLTHLAQKMKAEKV